MAGLGWSVFLHSARQGHTSTSLGQVRLGVFEHAMFMAGLVQNAGQLHSLQPVQVLRMDTCMPVFSTTSAPPAASLGSVLPAVYCCVVVLVLCCDSSLHTAGDVCPSHPDSFGLGVCRFVCSLQAVVGRELCTFAASSVTSTVTYVALFSVTLCACHMGTVVSHVMLCLRSQCSVRVECMC